MQQALQAENFWRTGNDVYQPVIAPQLSNLLRQPDTGIDLPALD
ncbi:hypothetical protein [Verminephrobacter aporrectodeae]|nr:hypothetical protein [Verminephrobacter aporrectodeae]